MRNKYIAIIIVLLLIGSSFFYYAHVEYALLPAEEDTKRYVANERTGVDVWGNWIDQQNGNIKKLSAHEADPSSVAGAVRVDDRLLQLGREVF